MNEGRKNDHEKPRMDLISSKALEELAKVLTFGAKKYDSHNWRKGLAFSRVVAAILRHISAYNGGEDRDPETGLSHIAHAMCGCMFLLEYEKDRPEFDDRYKPEPKTSNASPENGSYYSMILPLKQIHKDYGAVFTIEDCKHKWLAPMDSNYLMCSVCFKEFNISKKDSCL